jgi:hypothetical protein
MNMTTRSWFASVRTAAAAGWLAAAVSLTACSGSTASSSLEGPHDAGATPDLGAATETGSAQPGQNTDGAVNPDPSCVPSGPEVCDGKDNDCDGVIDNGFEWQGTPVGAHCYPGFGACMTTGKVICANATAAACSVSPGTPDESFHTVAAPNGSWDWNCNNGVDRRYPLAACESFTAATCPASGWGPAPGQSDDCGQTFLEKSCSATASGCVSSGSGRTVVEGCK